MGLPENSRAGSSRCALAAGICLALLMHAAGAVPARATGAADTLRAPHIELGGLHLQVVEDSALAAATGEEGLVSGGTLDSVRVVSGRDVIAAVRVEADTLHVVPAPDAHGAFTLRFHASNADTSVSADLAGVVHPRTDLRIGALQSNETGRGRPGIIRVRTREGVPVAEVRADDAGRVPPVQLAENRLEYVLEAFITRDGERFGYVRTLTLRAERIGSDIDLPVIRAVPFDGLAEHELDPEDFREHVLLVTRGTIRRWESIEGVYVASRTRRGRFTRAEQERIVHLWTDSGAVRRLAGGRSLPVVMGVGDPPFTLSERSLRPHQGWIVVAPDSLIDLSSSSQVEDIDGDGRYDTGAVILNPARARSFGSLDRFVSYEAGRVLGMTASADPLSLTETVMVAGIGPHLPELPTFVDEKTGAILYEEDFPLLSDVHLLMGLPPAPPPPDLLPE